MPAQLVAAAGAASTDLPIVGHGLAFLEGEAHLPSPTIIMVGELTATYGYCPTDDVGLDIVLRLCSSTENDTKQLASRLISRRIRGDFYGRHWFVVEGIWLANDPVHLASNVRPLVSGSGAAISSNHRGYFASKLLPVVTAKENLSAFFRRTTSARHLLIYSVWQLANARDVMDVTRRYGHASG